MNSSDDPPGAASLTLVPPSPVTDRIIVDVRAAPPPGAAGRRPFDVSVFIDHEAPDHLLHQACVEASPAGAALVQFRWPTAGHAGEHQLIVRARNGSATLRATKPLRILPSTQRSTGRIDGAWAGFYHWSESEGRMWNSQIKLMTDAHWRALALAMHRAGMDIVVIQESVRNQAYVGHHRIPEEGYHGRAFYPSRLHPGRMVIAAMDPIEAMLDAADEHGMLVFLGCGNYAWFDFTAHSLQWHLDLADELFALYGHHPSFYGWYVGEEIHGGLV